jgi:tetratricopeptide (TPR) repeat protein
LKTWWLSVTVGCLGIASYLGVVGFETQANRLLAQTSESPVAQTTQDAAQQIEDVLELARQAADKGLKPQASELLFKALNLTQNVQDDGRRDELLIELAARFAEIGQDNQALTIAKTRIKNTNERANALLVLTDLYRLTGENEKALQGLQVAKAMVLDKTLVFTRSGIVGKYAEIGQYDQALALAKTIDSDYEKAEAGLAIAQVYFKAGRYDRAFEVAQSLGVGTLAIPQADLYPGAKLLVAIAQKHAEAGRYGLALEVTQAIPPADYRISALRAIARQYRSAGQKDKAAEVLSEAFKIAKAWSPIVYDGAQILPGSNASLLAELAGDRAELGRYDQAMQTVEAIGGKDYEVADKAEALLKIATAHGRAGQTEQAAQVLSQALQLSQTIKLPYQIANLLPITAIAHAEAGQYDKAIQAASSIGDAATKAKALLEMAGIYNRVGQKSQVNELLSQALQVAQTIDGYSSTSWTDSTGRRLYPQKIEMLVEISQIYRLAGQKAQAAQVLSQALQLSQTIEDSYERSATLAEIANSYRTIGPQEQVPEILSQALKEAQAIASLDDKVSALRHIADKYASVGQNNKAAEVLSQAIQVAKTLPRTRLRLSQLTEIAEQQMSLRL